MKRLRVLISAHEFSPAQGSECAVGWNICIRLAAHHDVTVLCASGSQQSPWAYRDAFAEWLSVNDAIAGLRVVFVDQPAASLRFARANRLMGDVSDGLGFRPFFYAALNAWHLAAFRKAMELGVENYDIIHQLTPVGFRYPGYLWKLGKPFFWGPIGGMYKVPQEFARWMGLKDYIFENLRAVGSEWQSRLSSVRGAANKAERVWSITENESRMINRITHGKTVTMLEAAVHEGLASSLRHFDGQRPLRVCWSGVHHSAKALPLLLHAISSLQDPVKIFLEVLGTGPETMKWKNMSRRLGLSQIVWHGSVPHQQALQIMNQADVFVHSSVREATSTVVLEALGMGLPVICHDACGMAFVVTDSCGIKIPLLCPAHSIYGFRAAITRLVKEPQLVNSLSSGALKRASELTWTAKARQIAEGYLKCGSQLGPVLDSL